jgi:hypothetical protein
LSPIIATLTAVDVELLLFVVLEEEEEEEGEEGEEGREENTVVVDTRSPGTTLAETTRHEEGSCTKLAWARR